MDPRPIGVFDSGMGGLTVLRALRAAMPGESFVYLGDTARLPYGTKSQHTVARYALQAAEELAGRGIKHLVVACNTASASALPAMRARFEGLPVTGVIEPGAAAAARASASGRIAVLATEGTIRGGAYSEAIRLLRADARVTGVPCGLFVALAEEGWIDGPVAEAAAERYLAPLGAAAAGEAPDTLVLGCTHFPVLRAVIARALAAAVGAGVAIVDSAETTATAVRATLAASGRLAPAAGLPGGEGPAVQFLATDGAGRFARVGERFLGEPIEAADVELVDL